MYQFFFILALPTVYQSKDRVAESHHFFPAKWIRIDLIPIWIQHFSSIRIRTQKVIESGSNADPDPQQTYIIEKNALKRIDFTSFSCP
jgi:hypothetical protein